MNCKKILCSGIFSLVALVSVAIQAGTCVGVPTSVRAGDIYQQEDLLRVVVAGKGYNLGPATDEMAQARYTLALTAFISDIPLSLNYHATDCDTASTEKKVPNSTRLVK